MSGKTDKDPVTSKKKVMVVEGSSEFEQGFALDVSHSKNAHNRYKLLGVGCTSREPVGSGVLVGGEIQEILKLEGTKGHFSGVVGLQADNQRPAHPGIVGQCHGSGLHIKAGGEQGAGLF